jgi:hypothetical protein
MKSYLPGNLGRKNKSVGEQKIKAGKFFLAFTRLYFIEIRNSLNPEYPFVSFSRHF